MRKSVFFLFVCVFILCSCSNNASSVDKTNLNFLSDVALAQSITIAPTLTPFQPISPTETQGPTPTLPPTATFTPSPSPTLAYGFDLGLPRPAGQINILLLGSDWRPNGGYRTDVMLVVSLNPQKETVSILSFPRDLYVVLPGRGYERINTTQEFGGFALTQSTFQNNFDVPIDYYLMTDFNGFVSIINSLGGITVNTTNNFTDKCSLPQSIDGYCTLSAGENYIDGATALWYVRSRYSTSDFDRIRRAQEVILAIFKKMVSLDALSRAEDTYNAYISSVETDIPLTVLVDLIPLANKIAVDPSMIKRYLINSSNTYSYIVPNSGAAVLLPDNPSIMEIIRQAIYQ